METDENNEARSFEDSENTEKIQTHEILKLLYDHHAQNEYEFVCADEVGDKVGFANRRLDFVACSCWSSSGFKISAYEIKVSKADLRHDLEDPSKHNLFFDSIDTYTIIAPAYVLDKEYRDMIPPKWGIVTVTKKTGEDGKPVLSMRTVRKPMALNDEPEHKRSFSRSFAMSILRRCDHKLKQRHQRDVAEAYKKGREDAKGIDNNGVNYKKLWEEDQWLRNAASELGLWRKEDTKKISEAVKVARTLVGDRDMVGYYVGLIKRELDSMVDSHEKLIKLVGKHKEAK